MDVWIKKVKQLMQEKNITQQELADKIGVTRGQINHYLKSRREPPLHKLKLIAKTLGISLEDICRENSLQEKINLYESFNYLPVVDWVSAGTGALANETISDETEYVPVPKNICSKHGFILIVKGDSMVSTFQGKRTFRPGEKIIVDPEKQKINGSYVIVIINEHGEAVFKQYIEDGPLKYLKPLNTQYPVLTMTKKMKIIGVVVGSVNYEEASLEQ